MPKSRIIAGNWKMNGDLDRARKLTQDIVAGVRGLLPTVVLCPPFVHIRDVADLTKGNAVVVGGQDCHHEKKGAFTGDVSAEMLRDLACEYVIIGHSERRQYHHENNQMVKEKAKRALEVSLKPIVCVGETREERQAGKTLKVVEKQIQESIPEEADDYHTVIAYEPVWAIGTGDVPTAEDIEEVHSHITQVVRAACPKFQRHPTILYGGSVNAANAAEIFKVPGVNGALVGGASIDAEQFLTIIRAASALG